MGGVGAHKIFSSSLRKHWSYTCQQLLIVIGSTLDHMIEGDHDEQQQDTAALLQAVAAMAAEIEMAAVITECVCVGFFNLSLPCRCCVCMCLIETMFACLTSRRIYLDSEY